MFNLNVEQVTRIVNGQVQTWQHVSHFNWDAALTLGCCVMIACRISFSPINWVYTKFKVTGGSFDRVTVNILLGFALTLFFVLGIIMAAMALGVWIGYTLEFFGVPQGVVRHWTMISSVPKG